MNSIIVGGTFDESGGKPSKLVEAFSDGVLEAIKDTTVMNGGDIVSLMETAEKNLNKYNIIFWLPNLSNNISLKYVDYIKDLAPKSILISSKRVVEKEYNLLALVDRALKTKSNLIIEITKPVDNYRARVIDPLGNLFWDVDENFWRVGYGTANRAVELFNATRISSVKMGDAKEVPNEEEFFTVVRDMANVFDRLIPHPATQSRFVGNASFRCQRGFPSFRYGDYIYVSRRNVDKQFIDRDGFVAVARDMLPVQYYGDNKPSVDTPVHVALYGYLQKIKYMIHGHVYASEASKTSHMIPCGALEEFDEIKKFIPKDTGNAVINLRGHGCLVMAEDVRFITTLKFEQRPMPELMW